MSLESDPAQSRHNSVILSGVNGLACEPIAKSKDLLFGCATYLPATNEIWLPAESRSLDCA